MSFNLFTFYEIKRIKIVFHVVIRYMTIFDWVYTFLGMDMVWVQCIHIVSTCKIKASSIWSALWHSLHDVYFLLFVLLHNMMSLLYTWQMLLKCCLYTFLSASLFSRDERLWTPHWHLEHHHLHQRHPRSLRLRQVHLWCHRPLLDQQQQWWIFQSYFKLF